MVFPIGVVSKIWGPIRLVVVVPEAPLFVDAGALRDALQAEFPDATFVEGTKDFMHTILWNRLSKKYMVD